MDKENFRRELAELTGLEPGSADLANAHSKLAQWIAVKLYDPRILEIARHLVAWRIHGQRFDTAFNAAVDEGRALPSQRAPLRRFAMRDPDAAIRLVDALYPVMSAARSGSRRAPEGVHARSFDLDRRIHAFALEHGIDYTSAFERVVASAA
jgi:phage I-like protein